jgi:hypothetical protein
MGVKPGAEEAEQMARREKKRHEMDPVGLSSGIITN